MGALTRDEAAALVGKTVRSYDFEGRKDCYMEGVLERVAPAPEGVCSGTCPHLHIRVQKVVFRGLLSNDLLDKTPPDRRYVFPALNWCNIEEVA